MKKSDVHSFVWQATPAIQCARRFFHPYLKETNKNQQSIFKYFNPILLYAIKENV